MPANAPRSSVLLHRIASPPSTTSFYTHHRPTTNTRIIQQQQQPHLFSPLTSSSSTPDHHLIPDTALIHHTHELSHNQTCSAVIQTINAPLDTVWSVVRRFDNPQAYKQFVRSCDVVSDGRDALEIGTLRRVYIVSGLPAATSTERLEILDDERHVFSFSVVGGDHRLSNYRSVTTVHKWVKEEDGQEEGTVVVESYVVDTPTGNTKEETCVFVDTIVKCNLQSLAHIAENLGRRNKRGRGSAAA